MKITWKTRPSTLKTGPAAHTVITFCISMKTMMTWIYLFILKVTSTIILSNCSIDESYLLFLSCICRHRRNEMSYHRSTGERYTAAYWQRFFCFYFHVGSHGNILCLTLWNPADTGLLPYSNVLVWSHFSGESAKSEQNYSLVISILVFKQS